MQLVTKRIQVWSMAIATLVVVAGVAPAAEPPVVTVIRSDAAGFSAWIDSPEFDTAPKKTSAGEFLQLDWPHASIAGAIGEPALPVVRRLFVAPPGAKVTVDWREGEAAVIDLEVQGLLWRMMPVQLPIPKLPGASERAVFQYDETAYTKAPDLSNRAVVEEVGIVRGQRLFLLEVRPIEYDPVARTLTFWSELEVDVQFSGGRAPDVELSPLPGLSNVVLNPEQLPQVAHRGSGNYLIIVASTFETDIAAFATAKEAQGFTVTTYSVAPGTSNSTIKSYIESLWGGPDAPDYILLVGDTDRIPHWDGQGTASPDTDLQYACMDGTSDWSPDIAIGRFPADDATELQNMVDKTLYYENGPLADPEYKKRAVFMAGDDHYTLTEGTHNYVINTYMDPNGYQSDKLYEVTHGATTADVTNSFNDGRFYGIYSGHGGSTSWGDGPPFSQTNVRDLTNANMYSMICSFACSTGDYAYYDECFMETWVVSPNNAAVIAWGSSVSSWWDEDDVLERVLFDAIFDNEDDVKTEIGPIYNEAKLRYLNHWGANSDTRMYFEMYNLMGDPSLLLPSACSDAGEISLDREKYACESTAEIEVSDCGLNLDDGVIDSVEVTIESDSEPTGETVTLYETDYASAQFTGLIDLSETDSNGVLLVAEGDTVTATYIDEDDGQGGVNVEVADTATVDCAPPNISNIHATNIEAHSATVAFDVDEPVEPVRGTVYYGEDCGSLTETAVGSGYSTTPTVNLTGLHDDTTYFYTVEAEDEAGNSVSDDNGGACYTFTTPEVPDFFTEWFESSDNDLDNLSLVFTPDGGNDFYFGCVEEITSLPTDPAGGTTLSLSDDDYATVNLTGVTVWLYGQGYGTLYPGSNGYITFTHGDSSTAESLENHFGIPRISGLYDDLDPSDGGTVSWKQLADRVAVTWENVPEYQYPDGIGENTFQIEMFFDGTITISYLRIDASDGLAGLSEGEGLDPDFYETNLSEMGPCGPQPPIAQNGEASTAVDVPVSITLQASDDGLPDPPAALTYIITDLPEHGDLVESGYGTILVVPHELSSNGNQMEYHPDAQYHDTDSFEFKANDDGTPPEGGDSNLAVVTITVGGPAWDPVAYDVDWPTGLSMLTDVELSGSDPNGDPLTYIIESLPVEGEGSLSDPGAGAITAVPYTLVDDGNVVRYYPPYGEYLEATFDFSVRDATAGSNIATVTVTVGALHMEHSFPLDQDPGWTTDGDWAFGVPTGGGSHNGDPTSGHTGSNVYGYNLAGDYPVNLSPTQYLTTSAIDCSGLNRTEFRFQRWLGVEAGVFDEANLQVSSNGLNWTTVWEHVSGDGTISESSWSSQSYDISVVADGQSTVYVRWGIGPTDDVVTYPGWNLDDIEIWAATQAPPGDFDGDGEVDLDDFTRFTQCLAGPEATPDPPDPISVEHCLGAFDFDEDTDVDLTDFGTFQEVLAGT